MADEKIMLTLEANDEASQKIEAISRALRNMDKEASNIGSNGGSGLSGILKGFEDGVRRINSVSRQWNSTMSGFNRMVTHGVRDMGAAIYDFTSDSIDNFTKFSEQHAKVLGVMRTDYNKTQESQEKFFADAQKLKEQAMQIGTYGFGGQGSLMSITEVSQAQESLLKAGVDQDQILNTNVLKDVLTFAQANGLATDSAVSTAVTIGNQFGIPETEWAEMLDKITYTANMSIVEVSDVVQSLKWASGIAAGLDRPLEEVLGMLTILGDFGLKGSQAGTGIQALLSRILTGDSTVITQAQAEIAPGNALEKFYEFEKAAKPDGNLLPMADVLDELNDAMEGMTDEEQAWFAKKLFGLYQMKSAYALLNGEDVDLDEVIKEIETQSGGTNEMILQEILDSQYGQLTSLNNLWEGVKTDVGDRLNPFVEAIRDELFNFLKSDGNYDINFDNLQSALDESCDLIEEKYGSAIANAVRNVGELSIDLTQVTSEIGPELGKGLLKLIGDAVKGGGLFGEDGVFKNWGSMIDNMYASAEEMPTPELQELATAITTVVDWCGKLVAFNIGAKLVEVITSALQMLTIAGNMIVNAGNVIVNGGTGTGGKGTGPFGSWGKGGKGGTGTKVGPFGVPLTGGSSAFGVADDVAKAFGTTVDDVMSALGDKMVYTVDDIATYFGTSADEVIEAFGTNADDAIAAVGNVGKFAKFGKFAKVLGWVGTAWEVISGGKEVYDNIQEGDSKGASEAAGGTVGTLAGAWGGAKGGAAIGTYILPGWGTAIGGIIGAIGGALGGDKLGEMIGGKLNDALDYIDKNYDNSDTTMHKNLELSTPPGLKKDPITGRTPLAAGPGDDVKIVVTPDDIIGPDGTVTAYTAPPAPTRDVKLPDPQYSIVSTPKSTPAPTPVQAPKSTGVESLLGALPQAFREVVSSIKTDTGKKSTETKIPETKIPEIKVPEIKIPEIKMPDISGAFSKLFPQLSKAPFSDSKKQDMINNTIQIDDSITMQPSFKVSAPNVNVNVKVDQSGRVTKNVTILNPGQGTMLDSWYTRTSSQYGKTNK